jgi:hypothetical protein
MSIGAGGSIWLFARLPLVGLLVRVTLMEFLVVLHASCFDLLAGIGSLVFF